MYSHLRSDSPNAREEPMKQKNYEPRRNVGRFEGFEDGVNYVNYVNLINLSECEIFDERENEP